MPSIVLILRYLMQVFPFFLKVPKFLSYIWRFVKVVALHPASWLFMALMPTLSFIVEIFTGTNYLFGSVINSFVSSIISKIMAVTFDYDLDSMIDSLPYNVLQISCYLGITEALQIIINGLVYASIVLITLKINVFIALLKIKLVTLKRM